MKQSVKLIAHAISGLFPMMKPDEFKALKEDIAKNGVKHPVVLHEGRIIDGRNRYQACCDLGIDAPTEEWDGVGSLVSYVWSVNGPRRHLSKSELATVATEMLPMLQAEAEVRQAKGKSDDGTSGGRGKKQTLPKELGKVSRHHGEAVAQAAKLVGVNRQYVQEAKALKAEAPEVFEQVRSGEKTLPEAKREVAAKKPARKPGPKFNERLAESLFSQLEDWLSLRHERAGGSERYDQCEALLTELKERIEQWRTEKPL